MNSVIELYSQVSYLSRAQKVFVEIIKNANCNLRCNLRFLLYVKTVHLYIHVRNTAVFAVNDTFTVNTTFAECVFPLAHGSLIIDL